MLKNDHEAKYTDEAIFYLTSIKVQQRDFYGAAHTLSRLVPKKQDLADLQLYVEAVLNLMKRKYKEGSRELTKVIKSSSPVLATYKSASYTYRGYGYASQDKLEAAVQDFNHVMNEMKLDKVTAYNRYLCKGLIAGYKQQWEACLSYFNKAAELFERNIEPLFYKAVGLLSQAQQAGSDLRPVLKDVMNLVNKSLGMRDTESELYYARAILKYSLGKYKAAIIDLDEAIEKSEDNVLNHFMCRGECYSLLGYYREAFQDFNIVTQLDEGHSRAYLNKGRMAYLLNDTSQAFIDFQQLVLTDPVRTTQDNFDSHYQAGLLLMLAGAFEDAAKAFANSNDIKVTKAATLQIVQCYLRLNDLPAAVKELQGMVALDESNQGYAFDIEVLTLLDKFLTYPDPIDIAADVGRDLGQLLSRESHGALTSRSLLHWYVGLMYFYQKDYQNATTVKPTQEFKIALNESDKESKLNLLFNICLCVALEGNFPDAYTIAVELSEQLTGEEQGIVLVLAGLLQAAQVSSEESNGKLKEACGYFPELLSHLASKKTLHLRLLLDSKLPEVPLGIPEVSVVIKPCFNLPITELPSMKIPHSKAWLREFTVKSRQFSLVKCKYEAPWLFRVKGNIQFTEQVYEAVINLTESDEDETEKLSIFDRPRRCISVGDTRTRMFSDDKVQILNLESSREP